VLRPEENAVIDGLNDHFISQAEKPVPIDTLRNSWIASMSLVETDDWKNDNVNKKNGSYEEYVADTIGLLKTDGFGRPKLEGNMLEPFVWVTSARVALRMAEFQRQGMTGDLPEVRRHAQLLLALKNHAGQHGIDTEPLDSFVQGTLQAVGQRRSHTQ
jgi:hypothetical protein